MAATPDQQAAGSSGARRAGSDDWSGRIIDGRYVVHERLGEGGMGVVYVAEHLHLKKRVALKVIHPELAAHEDLLLRFKREALATGQLDHPHIAAAIDFGELDDGGAFIVMPLVRGHSLQVELDARGPFDVRRAARVGAHIADALSAAHAVGIVHRDLKPDNILLERRSDGSEAAKVLDFGVASLAGRPDGLRVDARPLTQAGTILGTPGYMSPEQATAGDVDHRTDLYALGVILWELCRGERLFDGTNITEIFGKQFRSLPAALELGAQQPGRELSALVAKLLAWDKSARPSSAADVREDLRRIAELPEPAPAAFVLPDLSGLSEHRLVRGLREHRIVSSLRALGSHPSLRALAEHRAVRALRDHRLVALLRPYRPHAAGALMMLLLVWAFAGRDDQATVSVRNDTVTEVRGAKATRGVDKPAARPAPQPVPELRDESEDPDEAIQKASEPLLNGRTRTERRNAAKEVMRNNEEAPRYLQLVADLELSGRCVAKKKIITDLQELGDARALPALTRLASQPRRGCGIIKLTDCIGCLRRELASAIEVLSAR